MTVRAALPLTHDPQAYALTLPPKYRGVYLRAVSGNKPAARKAMCLECVGWEQGAIQMIRNCPSRACPNHTVRPYQVKVSTGDQTVDEASGQMVQVTADRAKRVMSEERLKKLEEARKARGNKK